MKKIITFVMSAFIFISAAAIGNRPEMISQFSSSQEANLPLLASSTSSNQDEEFEVGKYYYLYNVGTGKYYTAGNAWGTQCSVGDEPLLVQFVYYDTKDTSTLLLRNYVESKGGWNLAFFDSENAMFVDRASQANYGWTIIKVGDYYRMQAANSAVINPDYSSTAYPNTYVGIDVTTDASNTALSPFLSEDEGHYINWNLVAVDVLEVTRNYNSGINNAQYTGTLYDGSMLGFYLSGSNAYFCGAISSSTSISVPEKISYNGTEYTVNYCGYSYSGLDFDEANNVTSLTLPASITNISGSVPMTITDLHLQSENPPSINSSNYISESTTVWVPQSVFASYSGLTTNNNSYWYDVEVHYEGWEPQAYTITVNTAGTFGNILLSTIEDWTEIDELTVIGHLSEDDMKLFARMKSLRKLDLSQTDITWITGCSGLTKLSEILLPSTVSEVGEKAFYGCSKLKEINLPNVLSIGESAFQGCSSLTSVNLPAATSIGGYAFQGCSSLTNVNLPAATSIGRSAFFYLNKLTNVNMPAVTYIGTTAFYECDNLTSVNLPAVTSIGGMAFFSCNNLTSVDMPTIISIDYSAFSDCRQLSSLTLSACLQSIGNDAFSGCTNLKDVYCYVTVPLETTAFSSIGNSATLHVPAISRSAYMLSESWYMFYKIVALDEDLDHLTINSDFAITSYTGLADKMDLTLAQKGHLTVNAESTFNLGEYTQYQTMQTQSQWDSNSQSYIYYQSTLISNNEIKADNVNLRLQVQTNRWNFISLPFDVNVSDIEYPEGTLWVIRKYSGADRAALTGNTWQNMTNGSVLQAGEGYILHCANEETSTVEFVFHPMDNAQKNGLFAYQDVVKPLTTYASEHAHNRSWNLVGNPYPAFFDTHYIEHNGVITVYEGSGRYGSYTAYSLLDDDYVLRPNEAFFVQCPLDATSMTFKAEGRTHNYENSGSANSKARISSKMVSANNQRMVYNFTLSHDEMTDRARLVINPDAKMDYEISCDASKFISDNQAVPQLYVLDNGIRYAIDERPLGDGIITLGARFGQAGDYTIALQNHPNESQSIILTDNETGLKVNLAEESYTFNAMAGTSESRFIITIGEDPTGIQNIANSQKDSDKAIYDMSGRRVNATQKGIYIIKQNGKSRKVVK